MTARDDRQPGEPPAGGEPLSDELAGSLDAYLDGRLNPAQAAALAASAERDPALKREWRLQHRVDDSIRRAFAVPPAIAPGASIPLRAAADKGTRATRFRALALAAAVALGVGGYWAFVGSPAGDGGRIDAPAAYQSALDVGFQPAWVCDNDQEFAAYTKDRFGTPWTVAPAPGLVLVGWRYSSNVLGPEASMLLATQDQAKIVVLADRAEHARALKGTADLRVHSRTLGDVVLYEISPLDQPAIIGRIRIGE